MLERIIERIGPVTALVVVAVLVGMQLHALFGSLQHLLDVAAEADDAVSEHKAERAAKAELHWQTFAPDYAEVVAAEVVDAASPAEPAY